MISKLKSPPGYFRNAKTLRPESLDLIIIADYNDDLSFNEVISGFQKNDPGQIFTYRTLNIPPFNTLATGFVISQLALYGRHKNLIIMSNTAPRTNNHDLKKTLQQLSQLDAVRERGEERSKTYLKRTLSSTAASDEAMYQVRKLSTYKNIPWQGHDDQPFVMTLLPQKNSGSSEYFIPVFFVHSGYTGSFLKDKSSNFWKVNITNRGTQFRSRDIYANAVASFIYGNTDIIGDQIDPRIFPDLPNDRVAWIDGYGNIKTTIRKNEWPQSLKKNNNINVSISQKQITAINRVTISGNHKDGQIYIQPGSSGGSENPFLEIVCVMGNAADIFKISQNYNENLTISLSAV